MIEHNNPAIDVNDLMAKIGEQIESGEAASLIGGLDTGRLSADVTTVLVGVEEAINAAESASQVRTTLGRSVRFVGGSSALQSFILRALAFIFRDQRNVNAALVDALRRSLQLNVHLAEEVDRLKSRVSRLEHPESSAGSSSSTT